MYLFCSVNALQTQAPVKGIRKCIESIGRRVHWNVTVKTIRGSCRRQSETSTCSSWSTIRLPLPAVTDQILTCCLKWCGTPLKGKLRRRSCFLNAELHFSTTEANCTISCWIIWRIWKYWVRKEHCFCWPNCPIYEFSLIRANRFWHTVSIFLMFLLPCGKTC